MRIERAVLFTLGLAITVLGYGVSAWPVDGSFPEWSHNIITGVIFVIPAFFGFKYMLNALFLNDQKLKEKFDKVFQ